MGSSSPIDKPAHPLAPPREEREHTCHDMNPPHPYPCAACEREPREERESLAEKLEEWLTRYGQILAATDKLLHEIRFCSNAEDMWRVIGFSQEVEDLHTRVLYEADKVEEALASSPAETQEQKGTSVDKTKVGLYEKFKNIERTDGTSAPGGKHDGCEYFVLDLTHDPHAQPALRAYADSCEAAYPLLARDLRAKVRQAVPPVPETRQAEE